MIAILGAGSLGRLWAASLPAHDTAFIPRPGQTPTESVTYRFQALDGTERPVAIPWLASTDRPDLILVTTKAGDTMQAIEGMAAALPVMVPIVLFQNGLGSQQAVAERWPGRPILAASTTEGANRPSPDSVIHAGAGETWVGALTDAGQSHVAPVVERLATSAMTVHAEHHILGRLWQKLVINAGINPFTAILDCPNGDIVTADFFQAHIDDLCTEIAQLMAASGQGGSDAPALRTRIEAVARATADNTSSMRSDMLQGRPTEIDYINGYLVRLGQSLAIPTPVNQMLTERVKQLSPR
ncbi:2-dehydropantoate 2-reductase [Marinobacter sp. M216]|uniref:2-dehydropantoate 2-reductase n=1 Tax=Marinobacter albus TaxID=3030833 RepID=A0ABT7HHA6_9GAMM|nr:MULTISPECIES: 2-dehydropantoate 2-reductase [unclassified Marinobacter]MBW7469435.1 2-dehydropantoate 2-reductase [Marinobacter sp. F4218]MDK9559734.1 2-dehydropantoate 2-reductase [Marinobacter sp. M216]